MFVHNINPVLLDLGPFEIRYYGLIYALGFMIGYFIFLHLARKKELPLTKEEVSDLLLYLIIGVVVGARIFYVLVYNLPYYWQNPLEVFAVWHGGLSFHGGLIGGVIAGLIFSKRKKIDPYELGDLIAIPFALGLALGRVGNFINGELYGRPSDLPWAVKFPGTDEPRHPSQIYSSIKNFFIFFVLWMLTKRKDLPRGFIFWSFVVLYSILRFIVEFYREPDEQLGFFFGFLSMGQILCAIMFLIGCAFMAHVFWLHKKRENKADQL